MSNAILELAGWTLIHFLWQGMLVFALVWLSLRFLAANNARVRYLMLCGGLVGLVLCPMLTVAALCMFSPGMATNGSSGMTAEVSGESVEQFSFGNPIDSTSSPSKSTPVTGLVAGQPIEIARYENEIADPADSFSVDSFSLGSVAELVRRWSPWLAFAWALGVLVLSFRLLLGWLQTQTMKSNGLELDSPALVKVMEDLRRRLGIQQAVRLYQSADIQTPAVIGWVKPVVLLPTCALTGLTMDQLTAVLAHELAHIRRHDYLVNLLQSLVEILLFYHPAVWWVSGEIRKERENCCDDMALDVCSNRRNYIEALLQLEDGRNTETLALAATGGSLLQRVARMLGKPQVKQRTSSWVCGMISLVIAGLVLSCTLPEQQSTATEPIESTETKELPEGDQAEQEPDEPVQMVDFKFMVVDVDGEPIPNAGLYLSASQENPPLGEKYNLTTAGDGSVTQEVRESSIRIRVWCSAKGFAPLFANWEPEYFNSGNTIPEEFTFVMFPGESIGGRIVDSAGEPIVGAKVQVSYREGGIPPIGKRQKYNTWLAYGSAAVVTDADGAWVLENVPPGDDVEVSLTINHPDYSSDENPGELQKQQSISMKDLASLSANITMKAGARLQGTITDAKTNKPVTDAVVVWGDDPYNQRGSQETRVDKNGNYRFPVMKPSKKRVTVLAPGFEPASKVVDIQPEMESTSFELKPGKKLEIQFVDPDGKPVPNAYVMVQEWRGSEAMYNYRHSNVLDTKIPRISDSNGLYTWDWAPADPVTFQFSAKNFSVKSDVALAAAEKPHRVTLDPSLYISGNVRDEDGNNLEKFLVVPMTGSSRGLHENRHDAVAGSDGFFEFTDSWEDEGLKLKIESEGFQTHLTEMFRVGRQFEPLDVVMKRVEPLEYEVLDVDGTPASHTDVVIAAANERLVIDIKKKNGMAYGQREIITNEDGKVKLEPPLEPRTLIAYSKNGYVEVADLPDRPAKQIRLKEWFGIHGDVSVDGEFDGAALYAWPIRFIHGQSTHIQETYRGSSKKGGKFQMNELPQMPFRVMFSRSNKSHPSMRRYSVAVEPKSDSVELEFPHKVSGQIVLGGTGAGIVDLEKSRVSLQSQTPSINLPPELARLLRKKRLDSSKFDQVVRAFTDSDNPDAVSTYSKCFDSYFIHLDSEGNFDFQLMRPGKYDLEIELYEGGEKRPFLPMGELKKTIEVSRSGADLGKFKVSTFPTPQVGSAIENLMFKNRKTKIPSWLNLYQGKYLLMDLWKPWDDQSKADAAELKGLADAIDYQQVSVLSLHTYNRTDGERMPKELPGGLSWVEGEVEIEKLREFRKTISALTPQYYVLLDTDGKFVAGGGLEKVVKTMRQLGLSK